MLLGVGLYVTSSDRSCTSATVPAPDVVVIGTPTALLTFSTSSFTPSLSSFLAVITVVAVEDVEVVVVETGFLRFSSHSSSRYLKKYKVHKSCIRSVLVWDRICQYNEYTYM